MTTTRLKRIGRDELLLNFCLTVIVIVTVMDDRRLAVQQYPIGSDV